MKTIVIDQHQVKLGIDGNNMVINDIEKELETKVSLSKIDNVLIYGNPSITTQLHKRLAQKNIPMHYFDRDGSYLFSMYTERHVDYIKQRKQAIATMDDAFCLEVGKKILLTKVKLQMQLIKDYDKDNLFTKEDYKKYKEMIKSIKKSQSINEMIGHEGLSAKLYFYMYSLLLPDAYRFKGRHRPASDKVNSLLNYGYHVLYTHMKAMIIQHGLIPGFACIHKDKLHHDTLASDLIEQWRTIIVDDVIMQEILKGHVDDYVFDEVEYDNGDVIFYLNTPSKRRFFEAINDRMSEYHKYYGEASDNFDFSYAVNLQLESITRAFYELNSKEYRTLVI